MIPILLTCLLGAAPSAPKEKLMVLEFASADTKLRRIGVEVTEQLLTMLSKIDRLDPVGQSDLSTMLGLERQKQLMGCSDDQGECLAELAGALGAPWILTGSLARQGKKVRIDFKLISTRERRVLAREGRTTSNDEEALSIAATEVVTLLLKALPPREVVVAPKEVAVAAVVVETAPEPAPVKSRSSAPFILLGVGGAVAIAGGVTLGLSFAQRGTLQTSLNSNETYASEGAAQFGGLQTQSGVGVGLLAAGATAAVAGAVWLLFFDSPPPAVSLRLSGDGAALSVGGTF